MQVNTDSTGLYLDSHQNANPTQKLDKDAFMKILVNQLRYQNPLSPQDSESFITQIVQLSTMEQMANMVASIGRMMEAQEFSRAVSLIGHEVTVLNSDGETVDGIVEKVTMADGQPRLVVNDCEYNMSSLVYIRQPEAEPPAQPPEQSTGTQDVQPPEDTPAPHGTDIPEQTNDTQSEPGAEEQQDTGTNDTIGG